MEASDQSVRLPSHQQRILKLLFKFRFISAPLLSQVMGISRPGVYQAIEALVEKELVTKVYEAGYRIDRKPAYYFLSKHGVTTVRKLMGVTESVVHTLYKNDAATPEFIEHCLVAAGCYAALMRALPAGADIFTKTEINRFSQFPKNRPDLYIRTPDGHDAMIIVMDSQPLYITRKRFDEIIQHSEDGVWDGDYPRIGFVLKNARDKNSFLYSARKKLDAMGMDEAEIHVLATHLAALRSDSARTWSSAFHPQSLVRLFE